MDELIELGLDEAILTRQEFKDDIEVYNFYNGDYSMYLNEQYA